MTLFDGISFGVAVVSAGAVVTVVARKFRILRAIDVKAITEDRHERLKGDLIAKRLSRKFVDVWKTVVTTTDPARRGAQKLYHAAVTKVETLEREYRVRSHLRGSPNNPQSIARVVALLEEAQQLLKDGEAEKAEQKFIEVISLHPTSAQAFQGLGEIYLAHKDYQHAKESLRHAIKLAPLATVNYLDLAELYQRTGQPAKAAEQCQKAVALEPNDPKNLDALITACIMSGDHPHASATLKQLEAVNPENQKLAELRESVAALKKTSS